jgi:hypothetical protein
MDQTANKPQDQASRQGRPKQHYLQEAFDGMVMLRTLTLETVNMLQVLEQACIEESDSEGPIAQRLLSIARHSRGLIEDAVWQGVRNGEVNG